MREKLATLMIVIFGLYSFASFANSEDILKVNPYSVESVEKYFPEAIEVVSTIDSADQYHYQKGTGPHIKTVKKIHYEALIPHMISHLQSQHMKTTK